MKKILAFLLSAMLFLGLASCGKTDGPVFENKIPDQIAFTYGFDSLGYESSDVYFCQIIGNDVFVYEDLGENIYGRFFEYKNGECNFYYRNYTSDNVWLRDTELENSFEVNDTTPALHVYVGPGYAFSAVYLQELKLRGTGFVLGVECDMYGIDDEAYFYDPDANMILKFTDPDMPFHYEVLDRSYSVGSFLDSPISPSAAVDFKAVFGK